MENLNVVFRKINNVHKSTHNVLILCHPLDFDTYLDEIASDFEAFEDYAIYCHNDPYFMPLDIEDYYSQLSSFSLFVYPATSIFLTQESRTKDIDLVYATSKHIPVLPIIVEPNLFDQFNEYSTIQALDRVSDDKFQEPYKDKLEKYLKSVLIDNEMIINIRKAFDAYIFLSYRKKDRKYAQEVISIIRKNEFMRDIAIWYDEYLTPGEDYNNEIADNLLKSKLMALVVTPNINERYGEKGNYVIEQEYPQAMNAQIPVLPIEMVNTDINELKNNFKDIQVPIKKDREDMISESLRDLFFSEGIKENNDAEHLFMVGLAYMNGIDVEKDINRGLRILEKASDLGHLPATEYLAKTYKENNYCYDLDKYKVYMEKTYVLLLQDYINSADIELATRLIQTLDECPSLQSDERINYSFSLIIENAVDNATAVRYLCDLIDRLVRWFSECDSILKINYPEFFDIYSAKYLDEVKMVAEIYDIENTREHFMDSRFEDTMYYVACCKSKLISPICYLECLVSTWNFYNALYFDDLRMQVEAIMEQEKNYILSIQKNVLIPSLSEIRFEYVDDEPPLIYRDLVKEISKNYKEYETRDPLVTGALIQILSKEGYVAIAESVFQDYIESGMYDTAEMIHNLILICTKLRNDATRVYSKALPYITENYRAISNSDLQILEMVIRQAKKYSVSSNIKMSGIKLLKAVYEHQYSENDVKKYSSLLRVAVENKEYKNDIINQLFVESIEGLKLYVGETGITLYAEREYQKYMG